MNTAKPLRIYFPPAEALYTVSKPVNEFNDALRDLLAGMLENIRRFSGVGIAANQVGIPIRAFVINSDNCLKDDAPKQHGGKDLYMVNPVITKRSDEIYSPNEACMSLPGANADVTRHELIDVEYQDENGKKHELQNIDGLLGQCIQHEMDHINGILITDYLSSLKRERALNKVKKLTTNSVVYEDDEMVDARIIYRNFL